MKRARTLLASRAAAAALVLALAACEDGISTPQVIAGHWFAIEHAALDVLGGVRTEDRLELQPDGDYVWTTAIFGPGGRASDGMVDWFQRGGEWGVDDGQLALRTATGMRWSNGAWSILDFNGEWERGFNLRRESERLILEPRIPPNVRLFAAPRTYNFQRVDDFDDAPQPPGSS